ncbi:receptor-like protein EIX2 [Bidens hawaiensis]|uniref:receptor-like protein EIX2 n=1 Tax=Bidens hawaiensis TaxID=980011 RepID=UPI00404B2C95
MGKLRDVGLFRLSLIIFLVFTITTCLGGGNLTTGCIANERLALLKFKHSVIDYGNKLSSWVGSDCCRWAGVRCDSTTGHVVTLCLNRNYWGVVFYHAEFDDYTDAPFSNNIDFQEYNNLKGDKVNSALAELRHLNHFDLSGNDFQSSRIPEFIGSLKHLRYLNLSFSNFGGMIPYNLGNLSNLVILDLGSNHQLAADDISWVSGLLSLKYLDLSEVKFSQTRILNKLIYMVPSLIELHLSRCFLIDSCSHFETSQLNSSSMLHSIKHLDLRWNFLQEPFPNFLRNMTSLLSLDLSYYDLSQPHSFEKLCNIIPTVTELYLTDCQLQNMHMSPIHANLSRYSKLQLLDLRRNLFKGEVTVSFMNMSSLSSLYLSENLINSYALPVPGLVTLDLSYNKIDQIGNSGMWKQCHLKQLWVDHNHIQGEMIGSLTNMSHCSKYALASLDLSWNQLNGSVPESIEKLTSLETLYLNSNQLTGCIPSSLGKLIALKSLSLEWNKLNGSVPESLGRLASLQMFSVSSNELSGTLPSSMGKLTKLKYFDVSNNSLEDVVTEANFASLSMLKYLYATPIPH